MTLVHKLHALHLEYKRIKERGAEDELLTALPWAIGCIWQEFADGQEVVELIRLGVLRDDDYEGIVVAL